MMTTPGDDLLGGSLSGRAIVCTRYDEEKSVVLHPDDYNRLRSSRSAMVVDAQSPGVCC
jgi:hypothetical protein